MSFSADAPSEYEGEFSLQRALLSYCHYSVLVSISYLLLLLSICLWHWLGSFCILGNKTLQSRLGNLNVFQREKCKLFAQQRRERLRNCLRSQFGTEKVRKKEKERKIAYGDIPNDRKFLNLGHFFSKRKYHRNQRLKNEFQKINRTAKKARSLIVMHSIPL